MVIILAYEILIGVLKTTKQVLHQSVKLFVIFYDYIEESYHFILSVVAS